MKIHTDLVQGSDEWLAIRTPLSQAHAKIAALEAQLEADAWKISPAMAQAQIDHLAAKVAELEARGIHSCHDECQRLECRQRRRIEELLAACEAASEYFGSSLHPVAAKLRAALQNNLADDVTGNEYRT